VKEVEHPERGKQVVTGPPWILSATETNLDTSPLMGQHNDYIFGDLLGLSKHEISKLREDQAIY